MDIDYSTLKVNRIAREKIITKQEKRLIELTQKCIERCAELKRAVIEEKYPNLPTKIIDLAINDNEPDIDYSSLMSPKELLIEAKKLQENEELPLV